MADGGVPSGLPIPGASPSSSLSWFVNLLSRSELIADSLIVAGFVSISALIVFQGYVLWLDWHLFNPLTFSSGAATLLIAMGGSKAARDWHQPPDQPPSGGQL